MSEIKSRILKTESIEWQKAYWLQDDNLKDFSEEAIEELKTSFKNNSFVMAFNVWQDEEKIWILDGHHRQKVLQILKDEGHEIPTLLPANFIDCKNIKEAAKLVLIYTSQYAKITQQGLFDFIQKFDLDFSELKFEIDIPDFSVERFEQKFDVYGVNDFDVEQEPVIEVNDAEVIIKKGDIFLLGEHRLICGNCLDESTINQLMDGEKCRILCTDPPYNLKYADFGGKGNVQHTDFAMGAGEMSDDEFVDFITSIMQMACKHSLDGAIHYIFMDFRHHWHMGEASKKVYGSPEPKQICVWDKTTPANGSFYRAQHEFCFIYKFGTAKHLSFLELKDRFRSNIWSYPGANSWANPDRERKGNSTDIGPLADHPTPKNTQMIADIFLDTTNEGDIILELFSGSGSAIIAGEKTKRKVYACEIEPKYVQSSIIRYVNFCNKNDININFAHFNGDLNLNDLLNEQRESAVPG